MDKQGSEMLNKDPAHDRDTMNKSPVPSTGTQRNQESDTRPQGATDPGGHNMMRNAIPGSDSGKSQ